ncbi:MAG: DUF1559 domain-containing protein [Armatimonadetes bacterium]|nr:DUF1559 domain-containing protein [Armatimonadota bacterium]
MRLMRRRRRTAGCTLVEVLVVSSALASLGSGGAFTAAMDKGRQSVCESNLRQLGMALQMFVDDNDGKFPAAWFLPKHSENDPGSIMRALFPYVKNKPLFMCPAAPEAIQKFGLGYLWNDQLNNMLADQIPNPSQIWVLTDLNAVTSALTPEQARQQNINIGAIPPAHVGGYNVLYADGHVKWSKEPPKIQPVTPSR